MAVWIILGSLAALVALVLWARLGVTVAVRPGYVLVRVRWGVFSVRLVPEKRRRRKKEGKKREKPSKKKKEKPPEEKKKRTWAENRALLGLGWNCLRRFMKKIRVDRLKCHIVAGGGDAARAAILYGSLHAGLHMAAPALERVLRREITVGLDYSLDTPRVYLHAEVSVRAGALLVLLFSFLRGYLQISKTRINAERR